MDESTPPSGTGIPIADQQERIIKARMRLMQRYQTRIDQSPALSDERPLGTGPTNRHGMPQLPVGQVYTRKWPVLDLGIRPQVSLQDWRLQIDGAVKKAVTLTWEEMMALEQVEDQSDFHCVTTWSKVDMNWRGVRLSTLLALVDPLAEASHVMCYGYDGYTTNVVLEELLKDDVLLVHEYEGAPLPLEHGGPARIITPQLYAWKGTKWIRRLEVMTSDRSGFWEQRGYSDTAHPWRDDRYQ